MKDKAAIKKMSDRELIDKMLEYSDKLAELAELEQLIRAQVLARGESFSVADIEARYYGESFSIDYQSAAINHGYTPDDAGAYKKISIDWRKFCLDKELELEPFKHRKGDPRVVIRRK